MKSSDLIVIDSDILGGTPVFKGTRVPIKTLFEYLWNNYTLDQFLHSFPTVTSELAEGVLKLAESRGDRPLAEVEARYKKIAEKIAKDEERNKLIEERNKLIDDLIDSIFQ